MHKLILTGSTGKTGKHFIKLLSRARYSGKIFIFKKILNEKKYNKNKVKSLNIKYIKCDINKIHIIKKNVSLFKNSYFLHTAGINFSKKIIKFCKLNKVKWLITVHTSGKFSNYKSQSRQYIKIDNYLKKNRNNVGITILYPTMIYGTNNDGNISKLVSILKKFYFFLPVIGNGENLIQPVYFKDLSKAYLQILKNKTKTFNNEYVLAGKTPVKFIEVLKLISLNLNKSFYFIKIPINLILFINKIFNFLFKKFLLDNEMILRMQEDRHFSISPAQKDFKYRPLDFKRGLEISFKNEYSL